MKGASMASVSGGRVLIFSLRPEIASVPEVWAAGAGFVPAGSRVSEARDRRASE